MLRRVVGVVLRRQLATDNQVSSVISESEIGIEKTPCGVTPFSWTGDRFHAAATG